MLLRHACGLDAEARAIEDAIAGTLSSGIRTADLAAKGQSSVGTREMAGEIVQRIA
jgi:3-isopropylmalate dehydrogenase